MLQSKHHELNAKQFYRTDALVACAAMGLKNPQDFFRAAAKLPRMVLVTANKFRNLLCISHIGAVTRRELEDTRADMEAMLAEFPADCRLLADFSALDKMEAGCETVVGQLMETIDRHGVGLVVRVIPDPSKDIGMNILTLFHYAKRPRIIECLTRADAARALGF